MSFLQKIMRGCVDGLEMIWASSKSMSGDPTAWDRSIAKFEGQDRIKPPTKGVTVFTGSSSFTFWTTLEQDMSPLPVINRGFGGSRMNDVVYYAERIVIPYHPRAVVLFAGTNDIAGPKAKSAQEVFVGYQAFVNKVLAALPETPIYYISITPSPSRWKYWPIADEANRLIKTCTESDNRLHFIDMTEAVLGPDGKPDRSLYRLDRLHPNKKGYVKWTETIKPILLADLWN